MARKIFRQGADIFSLEGDSARKLGATEFEKSFAPQAGTVVEPGGVRTIGGGDVEDLGQREDLFKQFFPQPEKSVVGVDDSINKISEGTEGIRDQATLTKNQLAQLEADKDEGVDTRGVDVNTELESLKQRMADISSTSRLELEQIEEAGRAAGAQFTPLIQEAEERARLGQAANIVAAGRKGGFQRARFAGEAALGETVGDVGFAGAGGVLERTESAFKRNINALNAEKDRAIALAKASAREAIRSGKQADFDNANKILQVARQIDQDARDAETELFNRMFKIRQEDRAQTTADFNIISKLGEGQTVDIRGTQFTGISKTDVDPFFTGSNIISLMKALPSGTSQEITDPNTGSVMTITGLATDDPSIKTIQSTSDTGEVTITSYRLTPDGGAEILNQAGAGRVGKTKTSAPSVTIVQQQQQAGDLGDATARLDATIGADGFYNTDDAIKEISEFSIKNPGKRKQIVDVIKNKLNPNDPKARAIITGRIEKVDEGGITITNPSGIKFEIK